MRRVVVVVTRGARGGAPGFTLMEIAVTMALVSVVALVAVGLYGTFVQQLKKVKNDVRLVEKARTTVNHLLGEMRDGGGYDIRPWGAVIIEDDCHARGGFPDCRGTDRLTVARAIDGYPVCPIASDLGGDEIQVGTVRSGGPGGGSVCCLRERSSFLRQAVLVHGNDMLPVVLNAGGADGDCIFGYREIVPRSAMPVPPLGGFSRGVVVLADIETLYVEWDAGLGAGERRGRLAAHFNLDGDDRLVGERQYLADNVLDLQFATGHHRRGTLFDDVGDDVWWHNRPEETGPPPLGGPSTIMVAASVTVGLGGPVGARTLSSPFGAPFAAPAELRTATATGHTVLTNAVE